MKDKELTILTKSPWYTIDRLFEESKYLLKQKINTKKNQFSNYGGHNAVTSSLINGLMKLDYSFVLNPKLSKQFSRHVHVLSIIYALDLSINLKKKGKINRLTAGPNLVFLPDDYNSIICSEEIDKILVPSEWVRDAYVYYFPKLEGKIICWFAGVDADFWKTSHNNTKNNCILYTKNITNKFRKKIKTILNQYDWNVDEIMYGNYDLFTWKSKLDSASLAVFLSSSESQGIALAEAWSMNVPTFVWNPKPKELNGRYFPSVDSAPYLTPETGISWKTENEFQDALNRFIEKNRFQPRKWILENMTQEISTKLFVNKVCNIY